VGGKVGVGVGSGEGGAVGFPVGGGVAASVGFDVEGDVGGSVSVTGGGVGGQVNVVSHKVFEMPPPLHVPLFFGLPELGSH